jgi:hypothetical protein
MSSTPRGFMALNIFFVFEIIVQEKSQLLFGKYPKSGYSGFRKLFA